MSATHEHLSVDVQRDTSRISVSLVRDFDKIYDPISDVIANGNTLRVLIMLESVPVLTVRHAVSSASIMIGESYTHSGYQHNEPQQYGIVKVCYAGNNAQIIAAGNDNFVLCARNAEIISGNASVILAGSNARVSCGECNIVAVGPNSTVSALPNTVIFAGVGSVITVFTLRGKKTEVKVDAPFAGVTTEDGVTPLDLRSLRDKINSLPLLNESSSSAQKGTHYSIRSGASPSV